MTDSGSRYSRRMIGANEYMLYKIDIDEENVEILRQKSPYAAFGMIWIDDYAKE